MPQSIHFFSCRNERSQALRLTFLLLVLSVGCGSNSATTAESQVRTAVRDYWDAIINPRWSLDTGEPVPVFDEAHAALHSEKRASVTLNAFNQEQRKWHNARDANGQRGTQSIVGFRLGDVSIDGDTAITEVTVEIGFPDPIGPVVQNEIQLAVTMKRDGDRWAILSTDVP